MTDVAGNPEEERRAEFYHQPWSQEAVSRYFYCKVMEALEHEASFSFSPKRGLACHLATAFAAAYAQRLSTTLHPHAVVSWLPDSSGEGVPLVTHQGHCNPAPAHASSKDPAAQAGAGAVTGRAQHLGACEHASLWTSLAAQHGPWALDSLSRAVLGLGRAGLKVTHQTAALWSLWIGVRGREKSLGY